MLHPSHQTEFFPEQIFRETEVIRLQEADFVNELSELIRHWIDTDFERLIRFLYRLDVHEEKLKRLLRDHPNDDAGQLIAKLIIERQLQKIAFRTSWSEQQTSIDPAEAW
ncbi:MAG: hypothetical protein ACKO5C_01660 [Ferruginibacter sp.]